MNNHQTRRCVAALLGSACMLMGTTASAADARASFSTLAVELNAAPTHPAQFIDANVEVIASSMQTRVGGMPNAAAEAERFLAAELAATETTRGSSVFGSPTPSGLLFVEGGIVSRSAGHVQRQRNPIARTVPLPQAAGLSLAGLVLIGLVRRRRMDALG